MQSGVLCIEIVVYHKRILLMKKDLKTYNFAQSHSVYFQLNHKFQEQ